ncbi:MAG TPA: hypothetical protein VLM37_03020 [Fibrobacteraceae bacterium]|nr:hypothetical protein [Fibrobacteraceae bacterium]
MSAHIFTGKEQNEKTFSAGNAASVCCQQNCRRLDLLLDCFGYIGVVFAMSLVLSGDFYNRFALDDFGLSGVCSGLLWLVQRSTRGARRGPIITRFFWGAFARFIPVTFTEKSPQRPFALILDAENSTAHKEPILKNFLRSSIDSQKEYSSLEYTLQSRKL